MFLCHGLDPNDKYSFVIICIQSYLWYNPKCYYNYSAGAASPSCGDSNIGPLGHVSARLPVYNILVEEDVVNREVGADLSNGADVNVAKDVDKVAALVVVVN